MSVRCIYIVPSHYAQSIKVDEQKDLLIVSDQPHWQDYLPLRTNFIHYIGNDMGVFEFARKTGALSLKWQPLVALDVEIAGLNRIILHLALLAPLTLRCNDESFSEIHLTHGSELFQPVFTPHMPLMVLRTDKHTGRIPALPNLHDATELHIEVLWDAHHQMAFDCLQLLPYLHLETLIIKGPINMVKALTQLPLLELELHHVPDLQDFPELSDFPKLEELTLCACETLASEQLQRQANNLPDLLLYYMSTTDQDQWKQRGYVYGYVPPTQQILVESGLTIELEQINQLELEHSVQIEQQEQAQAEQDAAQMKTTQSLFERMRTESVTDFFRNNATPKKEVTAESQAAEASLFERMRTESVTDFFRGNKTDTDAATATNPNPDMPSEPVAAPNEAMTIESDAETQQSLFQRMRTESVTDFFRNKRNK